jgi:hypothetical protein
MKRTMVNIESMAKEIANMTYSERVLAITRELHSATGVARADETLATLINEFAAILGMREQAASRFGVTTPAPTLAVAHTSPAAKPAAQIKNDVSGTLVRLSDLIDRYRTDDESPLKKVRFVTRRYYGNTCNRILSDHGDKRLDQINANVVKEWHKTWAADRGISMAHALITMLRMLFSFGLIRFEDRECQRLSLILNKVKFEIPKPRKEALTEEQANAIRTEAHHQLRPSLALAQAFQYDTALTQKDVIGEWIPVSESEHSIVINGDKKWVRGLRWEEIDADHILRHAASNGTKEIEIDLKKHPMVMEELGRLSSRPSSGPVVMNEHTSLPWASDDFREYWRKIATTVGIPKTVRNSDSRTKNIQERYIPPRYRKAARAARDGEKKEKQAAEASPSTARH